MAQIDDIYEYLVKISPNEICDDCLAKRLNLRQRQIAYKYTRELNEAGKVHKQKTNCYLCGSSKLSSSCSSKPVTARSRPALKQSPQPKPKRMAAPVSAPTPTPEPDKLSELFDIGFVQIGQWLSEDGQLKLQQDAMLKTKPALYAFVSDGELMYVGKTRTPLQKRLNFYSKPARTQLTNVRINGLILERLSQGQPMSILGFARPFHMKIGNFSLNLAGGLEDDIILKLKPKWNK